MANDIIGSGWAFPPRIDAQGGLALTRGFAELDQAILIILTTSPGQRVMRPTFGCRLHELVFAPNDSHTAARARRYVEEALGMWEPRIRVTRVDVGPDPEAANRLLKKPLLMLSGVCIQSVMLINLTAEVLCTAI